MKVKFNFNISIKPKQTRSPSTISYTIVESKVEGIVKILEDMTFRVEYKGKLYKITQESHPEDIQCSYIEYVPSPFQYDHCKCHDKSRDQRQ